MWHCASINCYPLIGSCAGHNEVHCAIMWATCVLVGGSLYSLGCGVGAAFQHYSFDMISSAPSLEEVSIKIIKRE